MPPCSYYLLNYKSADIHVNEEGLKDRERSEYISVHECGAVTSHLKAKLSLWSFTEWSHREVNSAARCLPGILGKRGDGAICNRRALGLASSTTYW